MRRHAQLATYPLGKRHAGLPLLPAGIGAHPHGIDGVSLDQFGDRLDGIADAHQQVTAPLEQLTPQFDKVLPEKLQASRPDTRGIEPW